LAVRLGSVRISGRAINSICALASASTAVRQPKTSGVSTIQCSNRFDGVIGAGSTSTIQTRVRKTTQGPCALAQNPVGISLNSTAICFGWYEGVAPQRRYLKNASEQQHWVRCWRA
jgi:hypothetical protein